MNEFDNNITRSSSVTAAAVVAVGEEEGSNSG